MGNSEKYTFSDFVEIVKALREKCPWDSTQTHESLKTYLRNEMQEVFEGIDCLNREGDGDNLCEELGDLLLLIVLNGVIAGEEGLFTMDDVIARVSEKMKFRHPKIFYPEDEEMTSLSWDELKEREQRLREKMRNTRPEYNENP